MIALRRRRRTLVVVVVPDSDNIHGILNPTNLEKILPGPISVITGNGHPMTASDVVRNLDEHTDINIVAPPERNAERRLQRQRPISALTARERQVALLVCDGLSNRQLGQLLNLTEGTVKVHLHKIYRKLGLRNRAALSALVVASRASLKSRRGKRSEVVGQAKLADLEV